MPLTLGLCHGCFDLLHAGHVDHLVEAKQYCSRLLVSISSDKIASKYPGRPIYNQTERFKILSSLSVVDDVIVTPEPSAELLILKLKPSFYFKGIDYANSSDPRLLRELDACKSVNCKVIVTKAKKLSTSSTIERCYYAYSQFLSQ